MSPGQKDINDIEVDVNNLYREEAITDLKVASIRKLTPIKLDGSIDESRDPIFTGQSHVMTPGGAVPINSQIEAKTLEEALRKFPEAIKGAVQKMVDEVKELQRQEASRIVVPDVGPGKIQL